MHYQNVELHVPPTQKNQPEIIASFCEVFISSVVSHLSFHYTGNGDIS